MNLDDLTPEFKEAARKCKTVEELHALSKEYGCELSDDELDSIAGGVDWDGCGEHGCGKHYQSIGCQVLESCSNLSCDSFACSYFEGRNKTFECHPYNC